MDLEFGQLSDFSLATSLQDDLTFITKIARTTKSAKMRRAIPIDMF
jgi:hypothetical protein